MRTQFNTYGDPPNSDLLRRYGHVDLVPLYPSPSAPTPDRLGDVEMNDGDTAGETILNLGNPSDVAEVRADLVVHAVQTANVGLRGKDVRACIEWWLDEGGDEYVSSLYSFSSFALGYRSVVFPLQSKAVLTSTI